MQTPSLFLKKILAETAKRNGESLHLSVGSFPLLKVDGKYMVLDDEQIITSEFIREILLEHFTDEERSELLLKREAMSAKNFDAGSRFKYNAYYQKDTAAITFYPIPAVIRNFSELNFSRAAAGFFEKPSGLIAVAGPRGSGKTSTIASFIEDVNLKSAKRILTVEKPIEYSFISKKSVIEQQEAGRDAPDFHSAFSYALKEDFDIIAAGEHREEMAQTLPLLCELASGNCLVVMEIGAKSAMEAAEKMLASFEGTKWERAGRWSLADALQGIICQRLAPRIGGGKVLAYELLINNQMIKSFIREGKIFQAENLIQASRNEGMIPFKESLRELADKGIIRREDAVG